MAALLTTFILVKISLLETPAVTQQHLNMIHSKLKLKRYYYYTLFELK